MRLFGRVLTPPREKVATGARPVWDTAGDIDYPTPVSEAYHRMVSIYVPRRYEGRIVVFKAADSRGEPDLGWSRVAREVEVHVIPGGHFTFITRYVSALGARLQASLQAARGK
jgi:thioesterase domain-containing protein